MGPETGGEYLTHKSIIPKVESHKLSVMTYMLHRVNLTIITSKRQTGKCLGISVCSISLENSDRPTLCSARLMASIVALGHPCLSLLNVLERSSLNSFNVSLDRQEWLW